MKIARPVVRVNAKLAGEQLPVRLPQNALHLLIISVQTIAASGVILVWRTCESKTEIENSRIVCINTIRILSADAVQNANSGHPGMPMGAAAMAYTLWTRFLKHNPRNPQWFDRDRFILSAGHGSMLLYSLLHLTGYDLSLDEIKRFRQWGSKTPGHPERRTRRAWK